jgi:hypothetical protein
MLEGLDKIDWAGLVHAYGAASDVPGLLRHLASPSADHRAEAMHELYGNIWHQGTVYQATAHAVPFLIELLESETVQGKDELCILLAHIARGTSYHDVHQHLPLLKNKAETPEWQSQIEKELSWVRKVKDAVLAGEPAYLGFLNAADPALRDSVAYLLASLGRPAPQRASIIWKRFEIERDERVQTSLLLAFGTLAEPAEANRGPLLALLSDQSSQSIKLAAAMALVRLAPDRLPQEGLAILVQAARSPNEYMALAESWWAQIDDMPQLIFKHLGSLEPESTGIAVDMLAASLPACEPHQAVGIAEVLLNMVCRTGISRDATFASLSGLQQRVLNIIVEHRNIWIEKIGRDEQQSIKVGMLLRSCGLPDKPATLLAFIDGTTVARPPVVKAAKTGTWSRLKKLFKR